MVLETYHENTPTADEPYPPMIITALPWIFGSKKNVPDKVKDLIPPNPRYEAVKKRVMQEEKRLMYITMIRPVESLLLKVNQDKGLLRLKQIMELFLLILNHIL